MTRERVQMIAPKQVAAPVSDAQGVVASLEREARPLERTDSQSPSKIYPVAKRGLDVFVALVAIPLTAPIVLLCLVASALSTRSWPLLAQTRVGQDGRLFKMYKIRTMRPDVQIPPGSCPKLPDDPRVTRVGRFFRKTSIDELPQLWNVLIGNMTLVGPRPALPEIAALYKPWQYERLAVQQGMTGWWQVMWRSEKPLHEAAEDDIYYVRNRCLKLDVQILWRTVGSVLRGRGAF